MKIQNTESGELSKEFLVEFEANELQSKRDQWLLNYGKTVRGIVGFRPGKIPLDVLRLKFGQVAQEEVSQKVISEADEKIRKDFNLEKALRGIYDVKEESKDRYAFTLSYDTIPDFEIKPVEDMEFEEIKIEVPPEKIDEIIERHLQDWGKHTEIDGPIEKGHAVSLEYSTIENSDENKTEDENTKSKEIQFIVGRKDEFCSHFNDIIIGKAKGDEFSFLTDDCYSEAFRGKTFNIKINHVYKIELPELTDELVHEHTKIDSVEEYRKRLEEMNNEAHKNEINLYNRKKILDKVADLYQFDLPQRLIDKEFKNVWNQLQQEKAFAAQKGEELEEIKGKTDEELETEYRAIAHRRVRLGFVISKIGEEKEINVNENDIRMAIWNEASGSRNPDGVVQFYLKNPEAMRGLSSRILEKKVIDYIFENAKKEIVQMSEEEFDKKFDEELPGIRARYL